MHHTGYKGVRLMGTSINEQYLQEKSAQGNECWRFYGIWK